MGDARGGLRGGNGGMGHTRTRRTRASFTAFVPKIPGSFSAPRRANEMTGRDALPNKRGNARARSEESFATYSTKRSRLLLPLVPGLVPYFTRVLRRHRLFSRETRRLERTCATYAQRVGAPDHGEEKRPRVRQRERDREK